MNKIVIVNQDSGYLMIDIANDYAAKGFQTTIITGRLVERDVKLRENIKVEWIIRYNRSSNIKRFYTWIIGTLQIFYRILLKHRHAEVLFVSNPPMAPLIPLFVKCRFSLLIFDLYPDAFVDYGFLKVSSWFVKFWTSLNKKAYKRSMRIFTLTEGMKSALSKYVSSERIEIVPLWTTNTFLKPVAKSDNPFVKKYQLDEKFVVMYSGNFGYAHQVEKIIDLAIRIKNERVVFFIIGGGPDEASLIRKVNESQIKNCKILPWQDVNILPYSLAAADLAVVTLSDKASKLAIPSKVFNYMSVGAPILSITGKDSDLELLVMKYDMGMSYQADQIDEMICYINDLANNEERLQHFRKNSLKASLLHTSKNVELITG